MFIRIISRPPGEAPEWVRDCWIGLILESFGRRKMETQGIVTGEYNGESDCYPVFVERALKRLSSDAADWWRTHCPNTKLFTFDAGCCEEVESTN